MATYKPFESISQSGESAIAPLIQVVDALQDIERGLCIISSSGDWKDGDFLLLLTVLEHVLPMTPAATGSRQDAIQRSQLHDAGLRRA